MGKSVPKPSLLNLSVEEENLAAIPFAVLERRVGKKIGKIEIKGRKTLPDGSQLQVAWQVQGNNELGLPTEQDLDIFVALGVLTFRNNFAKTVSFSGREIAKLLNIRSVHGKFYRRLKTAMDRFIPLRFRALAATDHQEEVKWCNVFQEASFSLDRTAGRCVGSVTWTDKLIRSMDSGFFRAIDAGRYMELDGLTAKHLYRFLAVAFEKTDLVLIDARELAASHLGILNPPKYLSRLMQTLEPAFEQLMHLQVLGGFHIVSSEDWRIALRRHPSYVPEHKSLALEAPAGSMDLRRENCRRLLERGGVSAKLAAEYAKKMQTTLELHATERAGRILEAMRQEEVLPHIAVGLMRQALDAGVCSEEGRELLDWCEIALEVCRHKKRSGQALKNPAGLLMKIIKDPPTRGRLVSPEMEASIRKRFRQREEALTRQEHEAEERTLVMEYEQFRRELALLAFQELSEGRKEALRKEKTEILGRQERFERISEEAQSDEVQELILQDLARAEAPPFEKWKLRKRAQQVLLPFTDAILA